ncbi:tail fiber protein [Paenibacillus xylanexedens]|uniref:tail fiber protein n=1 Tax=Paenibacillus xylanexedens TaxID=528191 RepID=UPI00119F540F|nr:phage tail protein [Paenibacillus xylanexedens]
MPQETDRLKLPLPLGNENVTRESINGIFEKIDAGVATQADLDALREAVSKMDIPDASLTQKGKVQLSSKTDGTSETVAATEKAVNDARVAAETNAKNASLPRSGGSIAGDAGVLHLVGSTHVYQGFLPAGANAGRKGYLGFGTPGGIDFTIANEYGGELVFRDKNGATTLSDLKSSVSNGKASIAAAITDKGVEASGSDTFSVLSSKIKQIFKGGSTAWINGPSIVGSTPSTTETTKVVIGIIPGFKTTLYLRSSSDTATSVRSDGGGVSGGYSSAYIVLRDSDGRTITLASASSMFLGNPSWCFVNANILAISPGKVNVNSLRYYPRYDNSSNVIHSYIPSSTSVDFNTEGPIEVVTIFNKTLAGYTGDKYQVMSASISLNYTYQ